MALTASLDKTTYSPGDTMTLTVHTDPGDRQHTGTIAGTVHVDGLTDGTYTAQIVFPNKPITITDPAVTWKLKSDDGTTAVYTATAPSS